MVVLPFVIDDKVSENIKMTQMDELIALSTSVSSFAKIIIAKDQRY